MTSPDRRIARLRATIKRIGAIRCSHPRPADHWVERSYDWYSGL